jgi:hypothetical protein
VATSSSLAPLTQRVLRHSAWDALLIVLAGAHAVVLVTAASIPLIGVAMWWNANTIAHHFIHRPFFRGRRMNQLFSMFLSAQLGVPQAWWRERHLRHHAGRRLARRRGALVRDSAVVAIVWAVLAWNAPEFLWRTYVPGMLLGLALCQLQGYFEHARGTTSHYGRLYNWLFFNDGLHVEHHQHPATHWRELPRTVAPGAPASRWPPVLRWIEVASLNELERLVLRVPALRRFVLHAHRRAFRRLQADIPATARIAIVGGGLFPRSAIIARELWPESAITLIEARADHLAIARPLIQGAVEERCERFDATHVDADVIVVPLALVGDRRPFYAAPPAPVVLVHDWIWRRRGRGAVVSWLLLKRLNLITRR